MERFNVEYARTASRKAVLDSVSEPKMVDIYSLIKEASEKGKYSVVLDFKNPLVRDGVEIILRNDGYTDFTRIGEYAVTHPNSTVSLQVRWDN